MKAASSYITAAARNGTQKSGRECPVAAPRRRLGIFYETGVLTKTNVRLMMTI
jgi:hypothetical protein